MAANNTYELTYIVNSVLSEEQIKDLVARVDKYIVEHGGEIIDKDVWGSQRLAYPIQKKRNGFYVNMSFKAPGGIVARFERALEINDNILRYLTLRMEPKMIRHRDDRRKARAAEATAAAATEAPETTAKA